MKLATHFFGRLRRLQWKLTLSYTLTTVVALLCIELLLVLFIFLYINSNASTYLANTLWQKGHNFDAYFTASNIDASKISASLDGFKPSLPGSVLVYEGYTVVVDPNMHVLASIGTDAPSPGVDLRQQLPAVAMRNVQTALSDSNLHNPLIEHSAGRTYITSPFVDHDGHVRGVLLVNASQVNFNVNASFRAVPTLAIVLTASLVLFVLSAGVVGTVFGWVTARGFVRRFKRVFVVVERWSQGDFSVFVQDLSGDELGQLGRQLNRMAEQLQNLFQTRHTVATLEERNRLARDLHDSVKQQVFAISMQISTVKALMGRNPDSAQKHLLEAESLVRQAQQELTSLIRELRPVALEGKGLPSALQDLATSWRNQTGIATSIFIEGEQSIPLLVEDALFRIAQEALSNVARHSHATAVKLHLTLNEQAIVLAITDNGQGFADNTSSQRGVGLISMQERVQALGGQIEINSLVGKGTDITVRCKQAVQLH